MRILIPELGRLRIRESFRRNFFIDSGEPEAFEINWMPQSHTSSAFHHQIVFEITRPLAPKTRRTAINNGEAPSASEKRSNKLELRPLDSTGLLNPVLKIDGHKDTLENLTNMSVSNVDISANDEEYTLKRSKKTNALEELVTKVIILPDYKTLGIDTFEPLPPRLPESFKQFLRRGRKQNTSTAGAPKDPATIAILNTPIPSNILPRLYKDFGEPLNFERVIPYEPHKRIPIGMPVEKYVKLMEHKVEEEEERERELAALRESKLMQERMLNEERLREEEEERIRKELEERILRERYYDSSIPLSVQVARELEAAAAKEKKEKEERSRIQLALDTQNKKTKIGFKSTKARGIHEFMGQTKKEVRQNIVTRRQSSLARSVSVNEGASPAAPNVASKIFRGLGMALLGLESQKAVPLPS